MVESAQDCAIERAVARLADDGLVAYPTETVWGLGARADHRRAIERLRAWKGRSEDAPLAVLVGSLEAAEAMGCELDDAARRLAGRYWPGPLTLVVPYRGRLAPGVARADGALGLRCSPHPVAHALSRAVAAAGLGPLTATSLNRSGDPPAADIDAARTLLDGDAPRSPGVDPETAAERPLWLEDLVATPEDDAGGGAPSSVVECTGGRPRILRIGALSAELLEQDLNA